MTPGAAAPMGGIGAGLTGGGMASAPDQNLQALMGQIRQVSDQVKQLASSVPVLAEEAEQINQLLKAMVVKAAQAQSMQTASGMAVPGAGGGA